MNIHVALFKWKKKYNEKQINSVLRKIRALKNKCKGIKQIYVGKNYHHMNKGFTHAALVIGESKEALEKYRVHPDHEVIKKDIIEMHVDGLGFDFKDL
ncbi:Dabb family protein [Candidatus Pacearchaeota archaeon]|nr:Dabb family protein [Candidatus Pacearchaeota archaeon]